MGVFGGVIGREQRRERGPGREERGAGGAGRLRGASGGVGVEEAGRELATAIACAATRLFLLAEVEGDRLPWWAGPQLQCWASWAAR